MNAQQSFLSLIDKPGATSFPGVTDPVVANLAVMAGFEGVYVSGNMTACSVYGLPDIGLVTMDEMASRAGQIARSVQVPVVADADTGYGNALNAARTVETFEREGVAAIHLEDQAMPKRCGHVEGKQLIEAEEMVVKLRAALAARSDQGFGIIARTDARSVLGFPEAVRRAKMYADAGADVIFPESLETVEEFQEMAHELQGVPLLANMTDFGRTPLIDVPTFTRMGYAAVIFPGTVARAMWWAAREALRDLHASGTQAAWMDRMMDRDEMAVVVQNHAWTERERAALAE